MNQPELAQLSNEELSAQKKKIKTGKITDAVIVGFLIGVAIYSTVKNGWGLLTFLPLLFLPIAARNKKMHDVVAAECKKRGL